MAAALKWLSSLVQKEIPSYHYLQDGSLIFEALHKI
jgi:hypothetical protein